MKLSVAAITIFFLFSFGKCNNSRQLRKPFVNPQLNYSYRKSTEDGTGKIYITREIPQIMGADGAAWLERKERQKEENSNLVIQKMAFLSTALSFVTSLNSASLNQNYKELISSKPFPQNQDQDQQPPMNFLSIL